MIVDPALLPRVLEAWRQAGIRSSTVFPSLGMRRARGLLSAFWPLEHTSQRTLWAVVEDPQVLGRAMAATTELIGDYASPNTGILFTVPVGEALGLSKRLPPQGATADEEPAAGREETVRRSGQGPAPEQGLSMATPVSLLQEQLGLEATVVPEEAPLLEVARRLVAVPNIRTVCVVDPSDHLVGLIAAHDLGEEIFFHLIPEEFLREVAELEDVVQFVEHARVRLARDTMKPPAWVRQEHTLREVFKRMHLAGVDGLPVVDDELRITGFLNLPELLRLWLAASA